MAGKIKHIIVCPEKAVHPADTDDVYVVSVKRSVSAMIYSFTVSTVNFDVRFQFICIELCFLRDELYFSVIMIVIVYGHDCLFHLFIRLQV